VRGFIPIACQIAIEPAALGLQPHICTADVEDEGDAATAAMQFSELMRSDRDKNPAASAANQALVSEFSFWDRLTQQFTEGRRRPVG
jgi:hypothetical protein